MTIGRASPVHPFWGALDLADTWFSGRAAPPHPGGAPNCGQRVVWEAYSHEVSSCGYWPGPPEPAGARWDDGLAEFVLHFELVRAGADPDEMLITFLQSTPGSEGAP